MSITFDPANKVILLDSFTVSASEIWSRWVDWVVLSDNSKYLPAFGQLGGVSPVPLYLYVINGWLVRPLEASGVTEITGNLLEESGGSPLTTVLGNWNSTVILKAPFAAQAINVNSVSGPTALEIANAVLDQPA